MYTLKIIFITFLFSVLSLSNSIYGQKTARDQVRKGNKEYQANDFSKAELNYRKAIDIKSDNYKAKYNLANALYKQKKYKEAAEAYEAITNEAPTNQQKASIYHNLGNNYAQQKEWEKSIKNYKEALKINPNDDETRYNLKYAQDQLKKQQQQNQQNQNKQNKDNKDQQNKNQQDKQDHKDQNDQNKKDQQNKENQDKKDKEEDQKQSQSDDINKQDENDKPAQQQEGKEDKMSKKDAALLLKAISEKDKKTMDKVEKKKMMVKKVKVDKDW